LNYGTTIVPHADCSRLASASDVNTQINK